jgi:putative phosphoribosyl transferase
VRFLDRKEAGRQLAEALSAHKGLPAVIYALPRGGVVPGVEIAKQLKAPLDLIIPRKIGHPNYKEYAVCAVTEDGHLVCNQEEIERLDPEWLKRTIKEEQAEAKRRRLAYLKDRPPVDVKGRMAIITDDGVATGLTLLAAIREVQDRQPAKVVLAIPVIPADIARLLEEQVDEIVALEIADDYLGSVGSYYDKFEQVEDREVVRLLNSLPNRAVAQGER